MSDTTKDLKKPVSVSIASDLIAWLDSLAEEMGITRSAVITILINRAKNAGGEFVYCDTDSVKYMVKEDNV